MNIQVNGVSFLYDNTPALHEINLSIPQGSLTVLCGVTGSGKSTLLRLLSGLEKPAAGTLTYSGTGQPYRVSMVFQQPETQLFAGSVYKDIEYSLEQRGVPKKRRPDLIRSALDKVGLSYEEFKERSPFLLSGGEKRRLCIAGAIAALPGLLILDEPTAGLDPQAAQALLEMVQELKQSGLTIVIGTHDLDSFLPVCDRVIIMSQGSINYSGPIGPLNADPAKLIAAGLEPPAYARIGAKLRKSGLLQAVPHSTEDLLEALRKYPISAPTRDQAGDQVAHDADGAANSSFSETGLPQVQPPKAEHHQAAAGKAWWQALDPRVKWLGMVLGSLVILGMDSLFPLLLSAGLTTGLFVSARISWRRLVWFFRPFLIMFLFLWILSALSWSSPDWSLGPLSFSNKGIVQGGLSVLRFLLLIAMGFLFTETTTGAPLREGLEWGIAPLSRLGIRTRNWSLAISITLQFVPWILGKLSQLQLALNSRGRHKSKVKRWTPRQIFLLIVPLLILVISMGDELATAVESRGYDPGKKRTPSHILSWRRQDTQVMVLVLLAAAILWWCS